MGVLTLLFLSAAGFAAISFVAIKNGDSAAQTKINAVKSIGLFAMVFGILGQLIGLFSAFEQISQIGEVSQKMLASGIRVSSITSIYGIIIFLICYATWFGLNLKNN